MAIPNFKKSIIAEEDLEAERKEIINRYQRLLRKAKPILEDSDSKLIKMAFYTSMEAPAG